VTAAAAQSKPSHRLVSPVLKEISRADAPITDSQVVVKAVPSGYWGGVYRTAAGELVTVYASNAYPVDPALGQRWADFLGSLVHGAELSTVTVLIATPGEIARVCGQDAVACYSARGAFLYTPGEDPGSDLSAEAVITHEYGHHVAANRSNAPWLALDYGPKRWASSMQVCAKARRGELAPGAEDAVQYTENPGEGWTADTTTTRSVTLSKSARTRTFTVQTPLDGTLKTTLRSSAGMRVSFDVFAAAKRVSHSVSARTVARTTTVCGARTYRLRVTELAGRGNATLTVAEP
jgi:hypothetical protein